MKNKYFIIWVEGLTAKTGEKVKDFTNTGVSYTTLMTKAVRVKEDDIPTVIGYLKRHGFADWVLNSPNTFVRTSYVPKGTLLDLKRINLG
jgi:hypothetical protein